MAELTDDFCARNDALLQQYYPGVHRFFHNWGNRRYELRTPFNAISPIYGTPVLFFYNRFHNSDGLDGNISIPARVYVSLEEAISDSTDKCREAINDGKRLYLLWSGGIDSTLALCAMYAAGISFTVLCNEYSRIENPQLYDRIVKKEFDGVSVLDIDSNFLDLTLDPNAFFITGELGDQTIGYSFVTRLTGHERNMKLTRGAERNVLGQFIKHRLVTDGFTTNVIERIFPTMKEVFPRLTQDNTTLSEVVWFGDFVFKYIFVAFRLYPIGLFPSGVMYNTHHFFNTNKFQQYAMSHYKENCHYAKITDYKRAYKEYIYSVDGNRKYRDNKLKEYSFHFVSHCQNLPPFREAFSTHHV